MPLVVSLEVKAARAHKIRLRGRDAAIRIPQPSSSIPVIVSKVVHTSHRSGFSFRGWTYATAAVILVSGHLPQGSDPDSAACLDTGCGVTLVDKH